MFDVEDHGQAMYARVVRSELARRLPTAQIRIFAPYGPDRPTRSDRGEPAEALGAWSPARVAELAGQLDLVIIGGDGLVDCEDHVRRFFVEWAGLARWHSTDAGGERMLRQAGVTGTIDVTPHPAVLVSRLIPAPVLEKRLEYLRLMGWYPREGAALVVEAGDFPGLLRVLDDHPELTPVIAGDGSALFDAVHDAGRPVHHLPSTVSQEDVAAAVSAADAYIGPGMTARAYGVPSVIPDADPAALADAFSLAMKAGAEEDGLRRMQAEVDGWLDRISQDAVTAATRRGDVPDTTRAALESELRAIRVAHRSRTERANAERVLLADRVARAEAELSVLRVDVEELGRRRDAEAAARAEFESEVTALRQTRTFRWTAAARALYRKAGGGR